MVLVLILIVFRYRILSVFLIPSEQLVQCYIPNRFLLLSIVALRVLRLIFIELLLKLPLVIRQGFLELIALIIDVFRLLHWFYELLYV